MAQSRTRYDECAFKQSEKQNASQFDLVMDPSVLSSRCFLNAPEFSHAPSRSIPSEVVDLESQLRSYNKPLGKCITNRYIPKPKCNSCENCGKDQDCDCLHCLTVAVDDCKNVDLEPTYSRLDRARQMMPNTQDRFEHLVLDVQDGAKIASNAIVGENSRMLMKSLYEQDLLSNPGKYMRRRL